MNGPPRWVEQYLRIPFVELGFARAGCHCWGLVCLVYQRELNIVLPKYDTIKASDIKATNHAVKEQIVSGPWQRTDLPQNFDVQVMLGFDENQKGRIERHIGIYAGPNHILHIEKGFDSTCVPVREQLVQSRLRGTYRYTQ